MAHFTKPVRRFWKRVTVGFKSALIERAPDWAKARFGVSAAYADMLLFDHGALRLIYANAHPIGRNAWRSSQPSPGQIASFARRGVKTVINLRGPSESGGYWLERRACQRHGIALVDFQVRSRAAPSREEFHAIRALFERISYPMMMHCKSGADRAGLMSTLYLHFREGEPIETARRGLSLRYGHIRQADTGILDHVFECYLADTASEPMTFMDWVDSRYDPAAVTDSFKADGWANRIVNRWLKRE